MRNSKEISIDADLTITTDWGSVFIEKNQTGTLYLTISSSALLRECIRKYQGAPVQKFISNFKSVSRLPSFSDTVVVDVKGRKILTYQKQRTSYSNIIYLVIQYLLAKLNF